MTDLDLHNDLKQLSGYIYRNGKVEKPNGWREYSTFSNPKNGFHGETFLKDNYAVVDFKGTDSTDQYGNPNLSKKDLWNDVRMGIFHSSPNQIVDARKYYEQTKKQFPDKKIILSGHSLGGSMAQILGAETGEDAVTFGAYGTANLTGNTDRDSQNITNYGNFEDPVFRANFTNHVGNTYAIHNDNKINLDNLDLNKHAIENMGDLSKGVLTPRDEVLNTGITKTVKSLLDNKLNFNDFNPNKVIFTEDIKTMPKEQLRDKIDYFMHQATKGLVMSKDEAKSRFENENNW